MNNPLISGLVGGGIGALLSALLVYLLVALPADGDHILERGSDEDLITAIDDLRSAIAASSDTTGNARRDRAGTSVVPPPTQANAAAPETHEFSTRLDELLQLLRTHVEAEAPGSGGDATIPDLNVRQSRRAKDMTEVALLTPMKNTEATLRLIGATYDQALRLLGDPDVAYGQHEHNGSTWYYNDAEGKKAVVLYFRNGRVLDVIPRGE